ncbi:hypothetical protein PMZ80_003531 [Knufia obscura]|uniref:DNA repair protein Rad26 n=1 Tax=Knufia obscura TaxID=1635080 RepID=A0ABR0RUJ1_9EURO|nr:hypothetical protein PMZ80_003531 [Knufia obscura]
MAGDFSDDEWDISDDQLEVLEHNAILSTQQQQQANRNDLNARSRTVSASSTQRLNNSSDLRKVAAAAAVRKPPQNAYASIVVNEQDSFDNPQLDEDGVPLVVEEQPRPYAPQAHRRVDETTQREAWRQGRYAQKNGPQPQYQPRPPARTIPHQAYQQYQQTRQPAQHGKPIQQHGPSSQSVNAPAQPSQPVESEALRSEVEQLRKEKEALNTQLFTARGEISVVRSKNVNDLKAAERQIDILKKQMQEQATKHQTTLQAKEAAYVQLVTDSNFQKHELDEQTRRVQVLQRQAKERPLNDRPNDINLSPRKGLASNLRDGFDDDEVMQLSPGRSPARRRTSKPNTPTKKRKQANVSDVDMPSLALRLSGNQDSHGVEKTDSNAPPKGHTVRDHTSELHLQFLQDILAFRPSKGQDTIVESLVKYAFPGEAARPLSSVLLSEASKLKGKDLPRDLLLVFAQLLQKCVNDEYYKPVAILLEAVNHVLDIDPTIVDSEAIQALSPALQSLIKINAAVSFHLANNRLKVWDKENPRPKHNPDVNTTRCLDLLFTMVCLVIDEPDLIQLFWRWMQTDFVLVLLMPIHSLQDITLMLELLSTSILTDTFGIITSPEDLQLKTETYIIDKVVVLLWDPPRHHIKSHLDKVASETPIRDRLKQKKLRSRKGYVPEPEEVKPTRLQICHLRLKALELLTKFIMTSIPHPHERNIQSHHGTTFILTHAGAIARLVRFLYEEVTNLYANHFDTHDLHAKLVNRCTTLLHHILLSPQAKDPSFDLTRALSGTLVGAHKFRVVMTRIALGDSLEFGLEPGITEDTREMARSILAEYVTPDEAAQLEEGFGILRIEDGDADVRDDDEAEEEIMAEIEQ